MANTLTDLIPDLYAALDVVSRELVGMIPAVTMDARVNQAAQGQDVIVPIVPSSNSMVDITPAMTIPSAADQVIGNTKITINKAKAVPFSWEGNEQVGLNSGAGYLPIRANQMVQAMRTLTNEVESDLTGLYKSFSRATGAAGTVPFATAGDFSDASQVLKILKDNGSPLSDNHLVLGTGAGANFIGKQAQAHMQGTDSIARQGVLLTTSGMDLRESGQIVTPTSGALTTAKTDATGYAKGATEFVTTSAAGLFAGDVIKFAGDTEQYVVAAASTATAVKINAPGLRQALPAAAKDITVVATAARNLAFNRSAIVLATRMPERPQEGDMALDVMTITDPRSGLSFEVSMYPGYRKVRYEIALAWGVKNIKPEHTAVLLG